MFLPYELYIHIDFDAAGTWIVADATGCSNACGQDVGDSGKAGAVTCSKTTGCDESQKPAAKQCSATPECGGLYMSVRIIISKKCVCT